MGQPLHAGAEPAKSKDRASDLATDEKAAPQSATGAPVSARAAPVAPAEGLRCPNPRRVVAGKRNRAKRQGLSLAGRERLRQAAPLHRPSRFSTGPRTPAGKGRVAAACRARKKGPLSVRELRAELAALRALAPRAG
jgi:hypothetical protein